jgi:hypothetical protein
MDACGSRHRRRCCNRSTARPRPRPPPSPTPPTLTQPQRIQALGQFLPVYAALEAAIAACKDAPPLREVAPLLLALPPRAAAMEADLEVRKWGQAKGQALYYQSASWCKR